MYLNNYQYLKNKETFTIILLVLISVFTRIPAVLIFGDTNLQNEWLISVNNLIQYGELTYMTFDGLLVPNLFMPPLYSFYLYFFSVMVMNDFDAVM